MVGRVAWVQTIVTVAAPAFAAAWHVPPAGFDSVQNHGEA
jgi:hypothetical protein